jgi:hypothetical protein
VGVTTELAELIPDPPIFVETVLLPFHGYLICDGLLAGGIYIGGNMGRSFHGTYMEIKRAGEFIRKL